MSKYNFLLVLITLFNSVIFSQTVSNDTVFCEYDNAQVIVFIQNYDSLKWQYSSGGTFINCDTDTNFTNTDDDTLLIPNIQTTLNNYKFRCISYYLGNTYISNTSTIFVYENLNSDFSFYNGINGVVFNANNDFVTTYYWDFGDDSIATGQNVTHLYENTGIYQTCLVSYHSGYCNDTTCKQVEVNCFFPSNVSLPNDTFVNLNQDFYYEINDVFEEYNWIYENIDSTSNIISINYNNLMHYYNQIYINLLLDSNCNFYHSFNIKKGVCKDFSLISSLYPDNSYCPGEEIDFHFSDIYTFGNQYQIDSISSIFWDFNDETPIDTGDSVTHIYNNCGSYYVNIYAFDEYGCKSLPTNKSYIFISDNIDLTGTNISCDTILIGDTIFLQANANQTTNYTFSQNDTIMIDDETGNNFFLYVDINDTITSQDFIKNVCINMEHSYMGDLSIELKCPSADSNTVTLHEDSYGGKTYLGEPIDDDYHLQYKIGYNYCFNMQAIKTWASVAPSVSTLPADDYLPYSSFDDLIGCPTYGVWQLIITDHWHADNGYIFNWSLEFDSNIVQNNNIFKTGYWQGENIDDTNSVSTFAVPNSIGLHAYIYTVENENGCIFDTTIYVYVDFPSNVKANNNFYIIYPNPVKDKFLINSKSVIHNIEIYDISGNKVKIITENKANAIIDVSELENGIYFVKINNNLPVKIIKNK